MVPSTMLSLTKVLRLNEASTILPFLRPAHLHKSPSPTLTLIQTRQWTKRLLFRQRSSAAAAHGKQP
ncbi:hypothetical protein VTK26DRAFT_5269 [Humicola hyalothermophila]